MLKLSILCMVLNLYLINCARILAVFPTPSYSHQIVFRPLIQELLKQGHQVTLITSDPTYSNGSAPINLTEIDIHDQSYRPWQKGFVNRSTEYYNKMVYKIRAAFVILQNIFEIMVQTEEVKGIIQKQKGDFDLLLLEACVRQTLAFSHIFKVPVIQISSMAGLSFNYKAVGSPTHPFLYPSFFRDKLYNLTSWEKLDQLYNKDFLLENIMTDLEENENSKLKHIFGSNIPSLNELANNIDLLFLNVHPLWIDNQPVPPNVVFIGGIHRQPSQDIPTDLLSYLDSSTNGVIYVSFGTNVNTSLLPMEKIAMLINVFSQLPYNILWKWDQNDLPGLTNNIKIVRWVPQRDLLKHPNIKLFITQCGLQSTEEAIDAGVPLIGIPILGDQFYNAEKYVYHRIGIKLDFLLFNEEIFRKALETILKNNSYRKNVVHLRSLMQDQPELALQRSISWINYVLSHGGAKHLRARAANITWSHYLELELLFIILLLLFIVFVLLIILVYLLIYITNKYISLKIKRA